MKINRIKYLYHGTNQEFETFDLKKAKSFKDFGKGFYLTSSRVQAQKWAEQKAHNADRAYIYGYKVEPVSEDGWKVLELLKYDKVWVDFICKSRIEGKESDYDIIYDRMADNRYTDISDALRNYNEGKIDAEKVVQRIKRKDGLDIDQYCFKSEKAIQLLKERTVFCLVRDKKRGWVLRDTKKSDNKKGSL